MSDDNRPTGVSGGIQVATAADAASEAGKPASSLHNPIDELRDQINRFIETAGLDQHHRMMAQSKAQELIFWIRAGAGRA